jgi:glycosyltransferase involved in cell wall biosynthesis
MGKQEDVFYRFIERYEKGETRSALQMILSHPDVHYDEIQSEETIIQFLINFVDASIFKGLGESYQTRRVLMDLINQNPKLSILMRSFLDILEEEQFFIELFLLNKVEQKELSKARTPEVKLIEILKNQELKKQEQSIEEKLKECSSIHQFLLKSQFQFRLGWEILTDAKPFISSLLASEKEGIFPLYSFSYPLSLERFILHEGEIPLIYFEPLEKADLQAFLAPFVDQEVIFVFQTRAHLMHALCFKEMQSFLSLSHHYIYLLELYPHEQFVAQDLQWKTAKTFKSISMTPCVAFEEAVSLLMPALSQCLIQPPEALKEDTEQGNILYQIAKRILFRIETERYGFSRNMAFNMNWGDQAWMDSHKGQPPLGIELGPMPVNPWKTIFENLAATRQVRPFTPQQKIRLAHVTPQVVDGGHAPSRILRNLLKYSDRQWFDPTVIITERLVEHSLNYPIAYYVSDPSTERGKQTLQELQIFKIPYYVENQLISYEMTAQSIAKLLKELAIDIVIFHGPDGINCLLSCLCDVPIRVLFEHGTIPSDPCFDLAILSTEESYQKHREELRKMKIESCALPFAVDVREQWKERPYTKEELGFPSDSFIMTTISNHLEHRLSNQMCHAIGQILQHAKKAFYAPIGYIEKIEAKEQIFAQYGVHDQVKFLGPRPDPSQYARSMDLYLNEFPFGSCLGMLDAMAAGCPVVSMYDENGPAQARYGGSYFGMEYVIQSGKIEEYVKLACRLIEDHSFYQEWSQHAKTQYEKHVNVKKYVQTFEKIIEHFIEYYLRHQSMHK